MPFTVARPFYPVDDIAFAPKAVIHPRRTFRGSARNRRARPSTPHDRRSSGSRCRAARSAPRAARANGFRPSAAPAGRVPGVEPGVGEALISALSNQPDQPVARSPRIVVFSTGLAMAMPGQVVWKMLHALPPGHGCCGVAAAYPNLCRDQFDIQPNALEQFRRDGGPSGASVALSAGLRMTTFSPL